MRRQSHAGILACESESVSRPRISLTWSVLLHVVGVAALLFKPGTPEISPDTRKASVTLLAPLPLHETLRPAVRRKIKPFHPPQQRRIASAPAPVLVSAPVIPHPEPSRAKMTTPAPVTLPESPAPIPQPAGPKIQTNVFEAVSAPAGTRAVPQVQIAGFSAAQTETKKAMESAPGTGGFRTAVTAPSSQTGGAGVSSAGFADARAGAGVSSPHPAAAAVQTGFSSSVIAQPQPGRREALSSELSFRAVEILYKPRPVYTAEARQLKLEGDVYLEVIFGLDSRIQVLRVSHSLGHGLDENAIAAASAIRFRPAQRHGTPVSTTASLRIHFELAY